LTLGRIILPDVTISIVLAIAALLPTLIAVRVVTVRLSLFETCSTTSKLPMLPMGDHRRRNAINFLSQNKVVFDPFMSSSTFLSQESDFYELS